MSTVISELRAMGVTTASYNQEGNHYAESSDDGDSEYSDYSDDSDDDDDDDGDDDDDDDDY
eukprot:COSAG01_NODE_8602_length_2722_cov_1.739611_1_plen_61_part_00